MHNLIATTPLGGTEARIDRFETLVIAENPSRALVALSARVRRAEALQNAAQTFLGVDLPEVSRSATGAAHAAFWIGPLSWMIDAPYEGNADLAEQVKAAVGDAGSVVEQTDGWCRFDLSGDGVIAALERLCNADAATMIEGDVTRTQIHHMGCYLWRQSDGEFAVLGPRSSAQSLHHALVTAANSTN